MIRTAFFALALTFAAGNAAFAAEAPQSEPAQPIVAQPVTQVAADAEDPSQPGPYTVVYRAWSDLEG